MREAFGDLFELEGDLLCVTTNGMVNSRGNAVMGGGCAAVARRKFPGLDADLGVALERHGNHVHDLGVRRMWGSGQIIRVCSFPTKRHWAEDSPIELILQSAQELMALVERHAIKDALLPRPGCGLGGQEWAVVKPLLEDVVDDRVIAVHFAEGGE